jgi:hypothetical protein
MRPGSRTKVSVPLVLPQNRHPERSALAIDRVTQRLWRGVEGPRRCLIYLCCSELFNHRSPTRFSLRPTTTKLPASCLSCAYIYILGGHTGTLYIGCRVSVVEKLGTAWVR